MNIPYRPNIGLAPDDHTGDELRTAMSGISTNFDYLQNYAVWCPFFTEIMQEISIYHEYNTAITEVIAPSGVTVQYSVDNGVNWITYTTTFNITVTNSRWRLSSLGINKDANIVIRGTKLI